MQPMLATAGKTIPTGREWSHEVKWDGVRTLVDCTPGAVRMTSRNGNDITPAWPDITSLAPDRDCLIDGEVIALDASGRPDFRTIAERIHVRRPDAVARLAHRIPAVLMAFDVLRMDGEDLRGRSLVERRERLRELELTGWQVPDAYDDGTMLWNATAQQGLEGIVSKRLDSRYEAGVRSPHWLKFAHRIRDSYVVGGWRPQVGTTDRLAALLVGTPTSSGLVFRGRVGSGITGKTSPLLRGLLVPRADSPFDEDIPREDAQGTFWTEPTLIVEVETQGHSVGRLRQPAYVGARPDLSPSDLLESP